MPKKAPPKIFLYLIVVGFGGLSAKHPSVHGRVATRYEIMKISCQSWSSVEVTYVQPPQVIVRSIPIAATNLGSFCPGRAVSRYHNPTRANRGPGSVRVSLRSYLDFDGGQSRIDAYLT